MNLEFLISLAIVLVIVGAIVYVVDHLSIDATLKLIFRIIAIVGLVVWLLTQLRGWV